MNFTLNGEKIVFDGDRDLSLMEYLKTREGISLPKIGCLGKGVCGACTVRLDEKSVLSCLITMDKVEHKSIDTNGSVGQMIQDIFSESLHEMGTAECSYCIPEVVMKARSFLEKNRKPTYQGALKVIGLNLCPCIGRDKVAKSILRAAEILGDKKPMA